MFASLAAKFEHLTDQRLTEWSIFEDFGATLEAIIAQPTSETEKISMLSSCVRGEISRIVDDGDYTAVYLRDLAILLSDCEHHTILNKTD